MADREHCFGCRRSCYVRREETPANIKDETRDKIFLYCSLNKEYMLKDAKSKPQCYVPENKNNPTFHSANKLV